MGEQSDSDERNSSNERRSTDRFGSSGRGEDGSMMCGRRFRRMLRCVERTGSSTACTDRVNEFLACERAVFVAALHTKPPERAPRAERAPQTPPVPTSAPMQAEAAPELEARSPTAMFEDAAAFVGRAVNKQAEACTKLVDMAAKPETLERLRWFGGRMLEDMRKSADAAGTVASRFFNGEDCGDPDCDACRGKEKSESDSEGKDDER